MSKYKPISCDIYDLYILLCDHHEIVQMKDQEGQVWHDEIIDVFTKESVEYLKTKKGATLRLDEIKLDFENKQIELIKP